MLRLRIASSLVLAPLALAAVWAGAWALAVLVGLAAVVLAWEWARLCLGAFDRGGYVLAVMGVLAACLAVRLPMLALAVVVVAMAASSLGTYPEGRSAWWMASGAAYIGVPVVSVIWLRGQGRETLFWLLFVVWATDIGAYAAGRTIGGPRLLPRISPRKTWAGLCGGIAAAVLVGYIMAHISGVEPPLIIVLSGAIAVIAQAGDFAESWVKRRFGVKDSSGLIPGHGGLLDRLDGLLAAAPAAALFCLLTGGGLLEWQ